jgi:hypothetical protein
MSMRNRVCSIELGRCAGSAEAKKVEHALGGPGCLRHWLVRHVDSGIGLRLLECRREVGVPDGYFDVGLVGAARLCDRAAQRAQRRPGA